MADEEASRRTDGLDGAKTGLDSEAHVGPTLGGLGGVGTGVAEGATQSWPGPMGGMAMPVMGGVPTIGPAVATSDALDDLSDVDPREEERIDP